MNVQNLTLQKSRFFERFLLQFYFRLIGSHTYRKNRFCDKQGNFVSFAQFWKSGFRSLMSSFLKLLNYSPAHPWIPYAAAHAIATQLHQKSVVLEFGSGRSTLWLAHQCRHVYSMEHSPFWFTKLKNALQKAQIDNVSLIFCREESSSRNFLRGLDQKFDLIIIDGKFRLSSFLTSLPYIKPGGFIYVDDTDRKWFDEDLSQIVSYVERNFNRDLTVYTDFVSQDFCVRQGMLVVVE
ncbi:MAG: class I SAM-dependent methyltransferase [Cyanobacteria bacterium J06592_8]